MHKMLNVNDYFQVAMRSGKMHSECGGPGAKGATTITVTRNEILYGLNQADKFILGIVLVDGDHQEGPYYVRQPFQQEPDWAETSKNLDLVLLLERAVRPKETL